MLDCLQPVKNEKFDVVSFLPEDDGIVYKFNSYSDPGERVHAEGLSDWYHIVLFKETEDGYVKNCDDYEAILLDPLEYISMLVPQGWYGMVCRKTTTSTEWFDNVVDKLFTE